MANIIEIIIKANDQASGVFHSTLDDLSGIGQSMQSIGAKMTLATAPIALALGGAVKSAMDFDASMTNVGAVLGKSRSDMTSLNKEVLRIGASSRAGPQAASEAFYDIVGGVADTTSHMAILDAAIRTAEAGSADLGSTTSTLISVMNSYGFAADDASFASDVLTRTVGMGVGSMADFAGAMPKLTGLTASVGIGFDQAAASVAYMTTKGFTASESVTRLNAAINSILTPNKEMAEAMKAAGIESGSQALQMYGLAGTLGRVQNALGGSTDAMAAAMGSSEAMAAANALNEASFESFIGTFEDGVTGATAAAQKIQLESPAAQFDLLKSKVSALGIEAGQILMPALIDISNKIMPIVDGVLAWANANPEAMSTLLGIALAAVAAGPVIGILGTAITAVSTAVGILLSPAFLLAGAIAAIAVAAQLGYPGGIVGLFQDAARTAQQLAFLGFYFLNLAAQTLRTGIETLTGKIHDGLTAFGELYAKSPEVKRAVDTIAISVGLLTLAWGAMQLRVLATNGIMAIYTGITWGLAAAKSALALASTAAAGGMTAFVASASAAVLPILAIAGAVAAVVAAVNHFNDVTKAGREAASSTVAQQSAAGQLTEEQLWQQTKRSVVAEYGADNPVTDGIARRLFEELKANMRPAGAVDGARKLGGDVMGGMTGKNILVGEDGPEILSMGPGTSGRVFANNQMGGGGGIQISGPFYFTAKSRAEAEDHAEAFTLKLDSLLRARG